MLEQEPLRIWSQGLFKKEVPNFEICRTDFKMPWESLVHLQGLSPQVQALGSTGLVFLLTCASISQRLQINVINQ